MSHFTLTILVPLPQTVLGPLPLNHMFACVAGMRFFTQTQQLTVSPLSSHGAVTPLAPVSAASGGVHLPASVFNLVFAGNAPISSGGGVRALFGHEHVSDVPLSSPLRLPTFMTAPPLPQRHLQDGNFGGSGPGGSPSGAAGSGWSSTLVPAAPMYAICGSCTFPSRRCLITGLPSHPRKQ